MTATGFGDRRGDEASSLQASSGSVSTRSGKIRSGSLTKSLLSSISGQRSPSPRRCCACRRGVAPLHDMHTPDRWRSQIAVAYADANSATTLASTGLLGRGHATKGFIAGVAGRGWLAADALRSSGGRAAACGLCCSSAIAALDCRLVLVHGSAGVLHAGCLNRRPRASRGGLGGLTI
jgi:hypothetical protein